MMDLRVRLPRPTEKQSLFIDSHAKRKVVRAGRRGGKTVGAGILSSKKFLKKRRILYAAPVTEQLGRFWKTVTRAFAEPIAQKVIYKNESEHILEIPGTETRIKAKTAWNADTLRGDYADLLILDEWQLMDEDAWEYVGMPMLLDNDGDAVFIYTPPSLHSRSVSKTKDPQHAAKMFVRANKMHDEAIKAGQIPRWETFHFTSHDNPYLSKKALRELTLDMTSLAMRQEILAEDINEAPGALWSRKDIDKNRVVVAPNLVRVVVAIDPSATSAGDEAGILTCGIDWMGDGYVVSDDSVQGSPLTWAQAAVRSYYKLKADRIVAESNNGGEMVSTVIAQVDPKVPVSLVHASRGKLTRAEPIAAQYEQGRVHHVGKFEALEDEMCLWIPGDPSPNRMDALVWSLTELMLGGVPGLAVIREESRA